MKTIIHFESIYAFTTLRIVARKIEVSDINHVLSMHSNTKVMMTLGGLRSKKQTHDYLQENVQHWRHHGYGLWILHDRKTNQFVGLAALRQVNVSGTSEVEVAYALMPDFWGQGLATEITRALVNIAFETLHLKALVCFTLTTNKLSQRVMEKVGFKYEREMLYADLPHMLYRLNNYPA